MGRPVAWRSADSRIGRYWERILSAASAFGTASTKTSSTRRKGRMPWKRVAQVESASSARTRGWTWSQIWQADSSAAGDPTG